MKVYISGPITGVENYEENFKQAENKLLSLGLEVFNPARFCKDLKDKITNPSWNDYMKICIPALLECDAIYLLTGWELSKGALLEQKIAENFKIMDLRKIY